MSKNPYNDINSFASLKMHQENDIEEIIERQPDINLPSVPNDSAPQSYIAYKQSPKHEMHIWASLLIVICLGSLGALSLAPTLFPDAIRLIVATRPSSIPGNSTPTTAASPFKESECTAQPADMKYLTSSEKRAGDNVLPPAWFQAGRSQKDLAYAKACAASFVNAYQTFNANNPQTFETCVYMLTDGGKQRFYGSVPNWQPDKHMLPMWRASIQQQEVQQMAQASEPEFIAGQYMYNRLVVWMLIPYGLSISMAGNRPVVENAQITVLLVAVPINEEGTGWQVSQWKDGNMLFKPSALL